MVFSVEDANRVMQKFALSKPTAKGKDRNGAIKDVHAIAFAPHRRGFCESARRTGTSVKPIQTNIDEQAPDSGRSTFNQQALWSPIMALTE